MCSLRSPVSHKTERLLINRQRFLQAARAVCNMMNFLCTGVTTNVSDNEKHPRIKDYKLLNFLKLPLLFLTYFFSRPAPVPAVPPRSPLPEPVRKAPAASPQPPPNRASSGISSLLGPVHAKCCAHRAPSPGRDEPGRRMKMRFFFYFFFRGMQQGRCPRPRRIPVPLSAAHPHLRPFIPSFLFLG